MKAFAVMAALWAAEAAAGQDLIDRREQARAAFLATPQGIYNHYCGHCHGDDATGGGRLWATELSPSPADLTALRQPKEYVIAAIRDGSAAHGKSNFCPPWGRTLSPENMERFAQYIVSLGAESPQTQASSGASAGPVGEPFPWLLLALLFGEVLLLGLGRNYFLNREVRKGR